MYSVQLTYIPHVVIHSYISHYIITYQSECIRYTTMSQYVNHIIQTHQKTPMSIHQSYQLDTSEPTSLNISILSISHTRTHQSQYINLINQSYQKPPVSIHQSVLSEATSLNTSITSFEQKNINNVVYKLEIHKLEIHKQL